MGINCNGACTTTCTTACVGCSTMCAMSAEGHPYRSGRGNTSESSGVSVEISGTNNEKIKSIQTECSACGAQAEIRQMGYLFIKECPYCGKKEIISV